ncbi:hypothetical protein [Plebeiibacterium sediminum]|uniref:Uncharacterized protein n=1 Tax=Plebeiibacterium sediminum TaxID=2992112 RepID=A0AAE3M6U5_9BACT|nr:hypothetical protein [Plebeiobacterium sediminum]MCW3787895.1 hypothetical protein [Plebeiobacterium sediminum]
MTYNNYLDHKKIMKGLVIAGFILAGASVWGQTLEVNPSSNEPTLKLGRNGGKATIKGVNTGTYGHIVIDPAESGDAVYISHYINSNTYLSTGGGNVGIGMSNPKAKLDVAGDVNVGGYQTRIYRHDGNTRFFVQSDINRWAYSRFQSGSNIFDIGTNTGNGNRLEFRPQGVETYKSWIDNHGNWTMSGNMTVDGIINSEEIQVKEIAAANVSLNGTLAANQITVKTNGNTADFVFSDSYNLKDLTEVENYIKTHKHLPDIPSAKEMEDSGVNLAEMNKLLLQKVEELTLYQIEKDKQVNSLKEKIVKDQQNRQKLELELQNIKTEFIVFKELILKSIDYNEKK